MQVYDDFMYIAHTFALNGMSVLSHLGSRPAPASMAFCRREFLFVRLGVL